MQPLISGLAMSVSEYQISRFLPAGPNLSRVATFASGFGLLPSAISFKERFPAAIMSACF